MKIGSKFLFTLVLSASIAISSYAQKELTEGVIKYEITDISSSDEQMQMGLKMMLGSKQDIYFTPDQQLMDISMMGGMMNMKTLIGVNSKENTLYMDMMGRKIMVKMNTEEMAQAQEGAEEFKPEITYFKDETKEIAGYPCYKAIMKIKSEGGEMELITYVTEKITPPKSVIQNFDQATFKGVPLEFIISDPGGMFNMVYTAQKVLDSVDPDVFTIDGSKYEEMTMEEFQKSMGNMGSLGF